MHTIDRLEALLTSEMSAQTLAAKLLDEDVTKSQQAITDLTAEFDRLVQERILSREDYTTFRRKVDEIVYQSKIENVELRFLAQAEPPTQPLQAIQWPLVLFWALCAGVVIGIAACYVAEFVQSRGRFA